MRRRSLLAGGGVGLVGAALAAPAIAQSQPEIKWRMATSWPKSLDTIYGGAEYLTKRVAEMTDNKFRIGSGTAGAILAKLGVVPQTIPGGDIYPALEKGTIDAAEWVGPYDDEKLGFYKVAKYYYTPGWWEGQAQLSAYINLGEWQKLPKSYQAILTAACADAEGWMIGKYDTDNVAAMRRLIAGGAQLRSFSKET